MNIVKTSIVATVLLVGAFGLGQTTLAAPSAGSYEVTVTCGSFNNDQAAAQAYFDANGQPVNLDQNGDGQACADPSDGDFTSTGPSAGSYDVNTKCASFNGDQAAAQAYFDANDQPGNLDQDGDGIACNDAAQPEVVQVAETPAPQPSGATVDALPNTGTGITSTPQNDQQMLVLVGMALVAAGAGAVAIRSRRAQLPTAIHPASIRIQPPPVCRWGSEVSAYHIGNDPYAVSFPEKPPWQSARSIGRRSDLRPFLRQ